MTYLIIRILSIDFKYSTLRIDLNTQTRTFTLDKLLQSKGIEHKKIVKYDYYTIDKVY